MILTLHYCSSCLCSLPFILILGFFTPANYRPITADRCPNCAKPGDSCHLNLELFAVVDFQAFIGATIGCRATTPLRNRKFSPGVVALQCRKVGRGRSDGNNSRRALCTGYDPMPVRFFLETSSSAIMVVAAGCRRPLTRISDLRVGSGA